MRTGRVLRIVALVAGIVLCLALALAACAARRSESTGPKDEIHSPDPGTRNARTGAMRNRAADAGTQPERPVKLNEKRPVPAKSNKGMLGMGLEGAD